MKKRTAFIGLTIITLLGICVPTKAERAAVDPSNGPWTVPGTSVDEGGARQVVEGHILSTKDLKPSPGGERGVEMTLSTEQGDLRVHIGPRWFLTQNAVNLTHGQPITVVGIRFTWDGKPAILADEIRQDDNDVILREPSEKTRGNVDGK